MLLRTVATSFAFVGRVLEELVQVVPAHRFDQLRHLGDAVVQRGDGLGQQIVGLVFEPMDLLGGALQRFGLAAFFEQRHRARDLLGLFEDDFGELTGDGRRLIDAVQVDAAARSPRSSR